MSVELRPLLTPEKIHKSDFKDRVLNYGQKCIILVHPFLSEFTKPFPKNYNANLDEVLKKSFYDNLPLVIAEEAGPAFDALSTRLSKFRNGVAYTLSTKPQSPQPELPYNWQDLKISLQNSGVKTALIGGQRFEFASMDDEGILDEHPYADWLIDQMYEQNHQNEVVAKRLLPYGCGGMMMCELMTAGTNVQLLDASYPSNKIALPNNRILLPA